MRLTLRTMLAYMDGLLEPDDAKDIGKKIEDSDFATSLFHRVRDVMRRLRLAAPSLTERGPGLDPNTVAEYLDNVLPADRVPDFEKVCLESEIHLAEVASSHQILTLVLGEPAEIDPATRQRMYELPQAMSLAEEERRAAAAAVLSGDGATGHDGGSRKNRPKPMVPEYLREPSRRRRLLPVAALMLLAGGFAGIILLALGQFEPGTPLGEGVQWLRTNLEVASGVEPAQDAAEETDAKPAAPDEKSKAADSPQKEGSQGKSPVAEPKPPEGAASEKSKAAVEPSAGKVEPPALLPKPAVAVPLTPEAKLKPEPAKLPAELTEPRGAKLPGQVAKLNPPPLPKSEAKPPVGPDARLPESLPPKPLMPEKPAAEPEKKPPLPEPGKPEPGAKDAPRVGRFMSDAQEVLLKFNTPTSVWNRVAPEDFLVARQPLMALPTYRPRIVIMNVAATVELIGGTRIELLPENAQGQPGVEVAYGRAVFKPLAQPGVSVRVVVGVHTGTLTLLTVESTAAMEVTLVHQPATDPETEPSRAAAVLYVARGAVTWEEAGGKKPIRLTAPTQVTFDAEPSVSSVGAGKDLPKWISTDTASPLDRRASTVLAQAFQPDRPASLVLMELTEHRQMEVRWLASRSLGYLGQFEPIVAALNDNGFKREWPDYVEQLRQAVARGPEIAAGIRQSLEKHFGQNGPILYRMLWGYTDKDLQGGKDAQLVDFLDHENLAVRVLAFWNLKDITGLGLYYRPDYPAPRRQQSIQRWKQRREAGDIRIKTAEEKSRVTSETTSPAAAEKPEAGEQAPEEKPEPPAAMPRPKAKLTVPEPSARPTPLPPPPRPARSVVPEPTF